MTLLLAILGLGLLIIVHEAGHYIVARLCKMRVERFSIGFGPALLKWKKGETQFQLAPIPFGGFVQITGMNPHEEYDENDPHVYPNRPTLARFATIFAGPATNYLTAIVMIFTVFLFAGVYSDKLPPHITVRGVVQGGAAEKVVEPGDHVIAVGGQPVAWDLENGTDHQQFKELVQASGGKPVVLTLEKNGNKRDVTVTPKLVEVKPGQKEYLVGLELGAEYQREEAGFGQAAVAALQYPYDKTRDIVTGLYLIITREVEGEVMGPVGITKTISDQIKFGWVRAFEILALLNVYLGLFNLLPLPALDGGRLAFLGYELATRRRPNPKIEAAIHMVGFLALFVIMILVTFGDIRKLFS